MVGGKNGRGYKEVESNEGAMLTDDRHGRGYTEVTTPCDRKEMLTEVFKS